MENDIPIRKYVPIGAKVNKVPLNSVDALLSFHTIIGLTQHLMLLDIQRHLLGRKHSLAIAIFLLI